MEIVPEAESELQEMVDRVISAETDNFVELAKIANLNPAQDFAGSSLRGTTLSAVDFSSANLDRVNFRGANLSDADFSDANLQNAKFGGADLSGAFLGNADLSGADLHKASLALAIGNKLERSRFCQYPFVHKYNWIIMIIKQGVRVGESACGGLSHA